MNIELLSDSLRDVSNLPEIRARVKALLVDCLKLVENTHWMADSLLVSLENVLAAVRGKSVRFRRRADGFVVVDTKKAIFFNSRARGFAHYRNGIDPRGRALFESYGLHRLSFDSSDIVVDCGANVGDLFLGFEKLIDPTGYIGFEPNSLDYRALSVNVSQAAVLVCAALGNVNTKAPLFVCTEQADSSLIQPAKFESVCEVEVLRLDDFCRARGIQRIKVLKIEAEGAEPEVLEGAAGITANCEFIAFDGGPERGPERQATFVTVDHMLVTAGFRLEYINFAMQRALYRNVN